MKIHEHGICGTSSTAFGSSYEPSCKKLKRTTPNDEEIDSDEIDGPFVPENQESAAAPPSPLIENENYNVEQKRPRLAQAYFGGLDVQMDD